MREQQSGVILNVSSIASICAVGLIAYKSSKAALNALTHSIALGNAKHGIRCNAILPGLMNTPMAVEGISQARGIDRSKLIEQRDAQVPLRGGMGSAWDVANAAVFLAPTTPASSPACSCRSTAGRARASADGSARGHSP
jgi:NAD(P)-dependent dehydrogenase (short-subunit alcohol dehydrogenase family)